MNILKKKKIEERRFETEIVGICYTILFAFGSIISSNWQDEKSTLALETSKKALETSKKLDTRTLKILEVCYERALERKKPTLLNRIKK